MTIQCPKCKASFDADASAGGEAPCPTCGATLRLKPKAKECERPCPACGKPVAVGAVICVNCGLNLKTGALVATRAGEEAPPEVGDDEDEEAPPSAPMRAVMVVAEYLPGLLRPLVLIASAIVGVVGLGILVFGLALFGMGALISAFAVAAAGVVVYAHGVAWLIDGEVGWLPEVLVDFEGGRWPLFFVLVLGPLVVLFLLARVALAS